MKQAEEVSPNKRYETAVVRVLVDSVNDYNPVISTNLGSDRGVILENSPIGTLVSSQDGRRRLQLIITDRDVVGFDSFKLKFTNIYSLSVIYLNYCQPSYFMEKNAMAQ